MLIAAEAAKEAGMRGVLGETDYRVPGSPMRRLQPTGFDMRRSLFSASAAIR